MGVPECKSFSVEIDGKEESFTVSYRVFSEHTMEALRSLHASRLKKERLLLLKDIAKMQADGDLPADQAKILQQTTISELVAGSKGDYESAIEELQTAEGKAVALLHNCDTIDSIKQARAVVKAHPSALELFQVIVEAGNAGIEMVGNSKSPDLTEKLE